MAAKTPQQRSLVSAIGGETRAGMYDGQEVTANARAAFLAKFLREVDERSPGLPEQDRLRRAEHLLRAHMKRLALASSRARSKKAAASEAAKP
jgi:hypothetical protein